MPINSSGNPYFDVDTTKMTPDEIARWQKDLLKDSELESNLFAKPAKFNLFIYTMLAVGVKNLFTKVEKLPGAVTGKIKKLSFGIDHDMMISFLKDDLKAPDSILSIQKWFNDNAKYVSFIPFIIYSSVLLMGQAYGVLTHIKAISAMENNKADKINITEPMTAILAAIKKPELVNKADDVLDKSGINKDSRELMLESLKNQATPEQLMENLWRDQISDKEFKEHLSHLGYDDSQQEIIFNLKQRIPPITDIIRMAVREGFDDKASLAFNHDDNYQDVFTKWGKTQGLSEYWCKMYWRAHWALPSPTQGYEMLHRGLINTNDLDLLLRMADYPTFWRDKLKDIAYTVYGRIDIRRMYKLGVFDNLPNITSDEALHKAYSDLGYNSEAAANMVKFTILEANEDKQGMTVARITNLYKKHLMTKDECVKRLLKKHVKQADIDYILAEIDYIQEEERNDALLDMLEKQYMNGLADKTKVIFDLSKNGMNLVNYEKLFETWEFRKKAVRKTPTQADIIKWVKSGVITDKKEAIDLLISIGYKQNLAEKYFAQALYEMGVKTE